MSQHKDMERTHDSLSKADGDCARTLDTTGGSPAAADNGEIRVPEKVGKYEIRGEIGRGACGVVHKGFDPFVQRDVAVKIALSDGGHGGTKSDDRSFFAEARAAGMLQHPHIVSLYDAGTEDALSYIVMEYIDGETLLPLCRRKGSRVSPSMYSMTM